MKDILIKIVILLFFGAITCIGLFMMIFGVALNGKIELDSINLYEEYIFENKEDEKVYIPMYRYENNVKDKYDTDKKEGEV